MFAAKSPSRWNISSNSRSFRAMPVIYQPDARCWPGALYRRVPQQNALRDRFPDDRIQALEHYSCENRLRVRRALEENHDLPSAPGWRSEQPPAVHGLLSCRAGGAHGFGGLSPCRVEGIADGDVEIFMGACLLGSCTRLFLFRSAPSWVFLAPIVSVPLTTSSPPGRSNRCAPHTLCLCDGGDGALRRRPGAHDPSCSSSSLAASREYFFDWPCWRL